MARRIIGPSIAGILVARIGEGWCFLAKRSQLHCGHQRPIDDAGDQAGAPGGARPALAHLIEGYRFARHTAPIRSLLLLLDW